MNWEIIRANIQRLMQDAGLNPSTLAARAGVTQPSLQRFLAGSTHFMLADNLHAISQYFGCTLSALIGEEPLEIDNQKRRVLAAMQNMPEYGVRIMVNTAETIAAESKTTLPEPVKKIS